MEKHILTIAIAFVLQACASSGQKPASEEPAPAQSGGSLPDFTLKDVDGNTVSLSDHLGKEVILLSFWANWCEPCKKEMLHLQKIYEARKEAGFVVLSVCMDEPETQGDARTFVKLRGFTFPVLMDSESLATDKLNPKRAAPFSMIVSRDRKIVWSHEGFVVGDEEEITRQVDQALSGK